MPAADARANLVKGFAARHRKKGRGNRITEDDPRWLRSHGAGFERKVGSNVTVPRGYVTGGSKRGRRTPR